MSEPSSFEQLFFNVHHARCVMIYLKEDEVVVTSRPVAKASEGEYRERLYRPPVYKLFRDKMVGLQLFCDWTDTEKTGWFLRIVIGSLCNDALTVDGVPQSRFCAELRAETSRFCFSRIPSGGYVFQRWMQLKDAGKYDCSFGVAMLQYLHACVPMQLELDFEYWSPIPFRVCLPGGDPIPGTLPPELKLSDYFYEKTSVDD